MPFSGNTQNSEKLSEETKTILETVARCSPEWSNDYHTRGSLDASRPLTVVSYREDNEDQLNVMLSKDVPPPVSMKFLTNRGSQTYSE